MGQTVAIAVKGAAESNQVTRMSTRQLPAVNVVRMRLITQRRLAPLAESLLAKLVEQSFVLDFHALAPYFACNQPIAQDRICGSRSAMSQSSLSRFVTSDRSCAV